MRDDGVRYMSSPDGPPTTPPPSRSPIASLALPHSFHPDLALVEAFFAVLAALVRIFGACVLFALWGGLTAWTWTAIPARFWRIATMVTLVAIFPVVLAGLMFGIGAVQRRLRPEGGRVS
jgi:hypothetical protein